MPEKNKELKQFINTSDPSGEKGLDEIIKLVKQQTKISEVILAEHFINHLNDGFDVYKEVECNGYVDIVAISLIKPLLRTAVEVKTALNFEVIEQAYKNREYFHYSYVAVPAYKKRTFAEKICKDYGIGILTVSNAGTKWAEVRENYYHKPQLNRHPKSVKVYDYNKLSTAGSQNDRITAFANTIDHITRQLKFFKKSHRAEIGELLTDIGHHWGSITSAQACLINYCKSGVIKDFEVIKEGKQYFLQLKQSEKPNKY